MQEYIQPFLASITSMEVDHLMEAAKDSAGAHVIEAFLDSSASGKHKRKLILKYVVSPLPWSQQIHMRAFAVFLGI